jgi:hypothetical protein
MATPKRKLYKTESTLRRRLRVAYPAGNGRIVLRTEQDWDKDIEPITVSEDGNTSTFELEADQPFLYFKPCLLSGNEIHWSVGPNKLVLMEEDETRASYPCFFSSDKGRFSELVEIPSKILGRTSGIRREYSLNVSDSVHAGWAELVLSGRSLHGTPLASQSD